MVEPDLFRRATNLVDRGAVDDLRSLIKQHPTLCASADNETAPPTLENSLLLHVTNWPGGKPNAAAVTQLLIESGSDPMQRFEGSGETVLHWAASNDKDIEVVDVLIDSGADIDALGGVICGGSPLMNALYFGFVEVADLLVRRGAWTGNIVIAAGLAQVDVIESWYQGDGTYSNDATRLASIQPSGRGILSTEEAQIWTYRAVICALVCQQYHVVDWFVDHQFDLDLIPDGIDWSCLHHAAYCGSLPMAMYLIAKGADLNVTEENRATPADYGAAHGHPDVMNYLIDAGGDMPIEKAASVGRLDKVMQGAALYEDKARLLISTIGNTTAIGKPIHPSIKQGRAAVARYLLQLVPDLVNQKIDGRSIVAIAEEKDDLYWLSRVRPN